MSYNLKIQLNIYQCEHAKITNKTQAQIVASGFGSVADDDTGRILFS